MKVNQVSFGEISRALSKIAFAFSRVMQKDADVINKTNAYDFILKKKCKQPFYKQLNKKNWE